MRDLSLHILDLAQNSIRAGAKLVEISLCLEGNALRLVIADDGCGMDEALLQRVTSPFGTTRTTRKVGLGIPLIIQNARRTGGDVSIRSVPGKGTVLEAVLHTDSIDCLPLGDLAGTMTSLIIANPDSPDFLLRCHSENNEMEFDTRKIRQALGDVKLNEPEIVAWMMETMQEEIQPIFGGVIL